MPGLGKNACKVVLRGNIAGIQGWSVGLWFDTGLGVQPSQAQLDAWAADLLGPISTWFGNVGSHMGPNTFITGYDVYHYSTPSLTSDLLSNQDFAAAAHGTGAADGPSFIAQVVSLRSSQPGRSGRGRIYVPLTALSSLDGDYTTNTVVNDYTTATATLIDAIAAIAVPFDSGSSLGAVASFTRGQLYNLVRCQGGNRYEVQRRRNDKFNDTYTQTVPL